MRQRTSLSAILVDLLKTLGHENIRGAEVGVLRGDTSSGLLQEFPELFLLMVDTWSEVPVDSEYAKSHDCAAKQHWAQHAANEQIAFTRTEFASDRRVLLRGNSTVAVQAVADGSLDFAFIDADHTYDAVRADIGAWWPKIRVGGILAGHDYGGRKNRLGFWGVSRAVNEFTEREKLTLQRAPRSIWWVTRQVSVA